MLKIFKSLKKILNIISEINRQLIQMIDQVPYQEWIKIKIYMVIMLLHQENYKYKMIIMFTLLLQHNHNYPKQMEKWYFEMKKMNGLLYQNIIIIYIRKKKKKLQNEFMNKNKIFENN